MDKALTVQELYDYCKINNCTDLKLNIGITDDYHASLFDEEVTIKNLEIDTECGYFNINIKINEA